MNRTIGVQLLDDPIFGIIDGKGLHSKINLPNLLARLAQEQEIEFTALQPHQQHAWHAFLVQLAVIAITRSKDNEEIKQTESEWRSLLIQAAKSDGAGQNAFALIVDDVTMPAFMQPPIPSGNLQELNIKHTSPNGMLDVLITTKNHDVKMSCLNSPSPELWIYALITLQTMQGFSGEGNWGIIRMNKGYGSRPCYAFTPNQNRSTRFKRDVEVILKSREEPDTRYEQNGTKALLWCIPWDGEQQLGIQTLDPHFIEVCRRVRLTKGDGGTLIAHRGSSETARIKGDNIDDPWTPVKREDGQCLTVSKAGFHYSLVNELLLGTEWKFGFAGVLRPEDGEEPWLLLQVLVRGQGKTEGYHERWVQIPKRACIMLLNDSQREDTRKIAMNWVKRAGEARLKVLKPALLMLIQGGPDQKKLKFDDNRANTILQKFDDNIDTEFFKLLFQSIGDSQDKVDAFWDTWLFNAIEKYFKNTINYVTISPARRQRAIAYAEQILNKKARKYLQFAFPLNSKLIEKNEYDSNKIG